jgi:hypothetical protein
MADETTLPYRELFRGWLGLGIAAALLAALADTGTLAATLTFATSDLGGFVCYFSYAFSMFGWASLPIAAGCALAERAFSPRVPKAEDVLATSFGSILACAGVFLLLSKLTPEVGEFPARLGFFRAVVLLGWLGGGFGVTRFLFTPLLTRLVERRPFLARPRAYLAVLFGLTAVLLLSLSYVVFGALHQHGLAGVSTALGLAAVIVMLRQLELRIGLRERRILGGIWLASLALGPLVTWQNPHARFLMFAHSSGAGPLAELVQRLGDFDGDGSAPPWLGGDDCAAFDPSRAPAEREVPGDGVDQDCRGGDAPALKQLALQVSLWPDCEPPEHPSVLLLTIDALRADALAPERTPQLEQLASRSLVFTRAYSSATVTGASIGSLFTLRTFSDRTRSNPLRFGGFEDTPGALAERFRRAGYRTLAFNYFKHPDDVLRGFEQQNPELVDPHVRGVTRQFTSAGLTSAIVRAATALRDQRFFIWAHYTDAHAPYLDPGVKSSRAKGLSPYEREVSYVDFHLGRLFVELEASGILAHTLVAVTSDHGEDLGRHGHEGHGPDAFEDAIHVPLLLGVPGCRPRPIAEPVSVRSLGPTLGALAGLSVPGRPLFPGANGDGLPVVTEATLLDQGAFKRAVIDERYKLIVDVRRGGRLLFDLRNDPDESSNLYSSEPKIAARLEALYQRWLDHPGQR